MSFDLHSLDSDSNTNTVNTSDASATSSTDSAPIINWNSVYNKQRQVLTNPFLVPIQRHRSVTTNSFNKGHINEFFGHIPASPMHLHLHSKHAICDPTQRFGVYACYAASFPTLRPPQLPPLPSLPPLPVLTNLPILKMQRYAHTAKTLNTMPLKTAKQQTKNAFSAMDQNHALNKPKKSALNKPFKCGSCTKSFRNKSGLSNHKIIHNGLKPHKCTFNQCNKAFGRSCDLTRHLRLHTGDKPFKCEVCRKAFTRSVQLRLHVMDHTGKRPYHCSICKKGFKTLQNQQIHMRIHTGEKPYQCLLCAKKFTQSSSLKTHLSSIHNN